MNEFAFGNQFLGATISSKGSFFEPVASLYPSTNAKESNVFNAFTADTVKCFGRVRINGDGPLMDMAILERPPGSGTHHLAMMLIDDANIKVNRDREEGGGDGKEIERNRHRHRHRIRVVTRELPAHSIPSGVPLYLLDGPVVLADRTYASRAQVKGSVPSTTSTTTTPIHAPEYVYIALDQAPSALPLPLPLRPSTAAGLVTVLVLLE